MSRVYRSPLRQDRMAQTITRILDTAVRLHGQGITETNAIAREAGVSVATVRKYFPTREHLFRGCTNHFLKSFQVPSIESLAALPTPTARLTQTVDRVYGMHQATLGQMWLALQLQEESPVMAQTVAQADTLVRAAADLLVQDRSGAAALGAESTVGYVRGMLSPLTYRALRLTGGLHHDDAVQAIVGTLSSLLGIPLH